VENSSEKSTDVSSGVVGFTFKWADREAGGVKLSPPTTTRDGALRPGREGGGHRATFILDGASRIITYKAHE